MLFRVFTYPLIIFALSPFPLRAAADSYTQILRGQVIDADSKSPVPGAVIQLIDADTTMVTASNSDGKFRLEKVPVGRRGLKITLLGYEEVILKNIIVTTGKEVVLTIEMREKVYEAAAVEVVFEKDKTKANNDLVTNSARNFHSEETERYAGSRDDPSKMVANYAGVATGNDARNDIVVRGNSPLGVLWRLEGVDIPNPNHFSLQGSTGGPVSMLNNNILGNSDFLTGAFPAEYGNKMGAVFDLKIRHGNNEKNEFTGQVGFNGAELGIEGPFIKKNGGSFLASYRYSTLEAFKALGINFGVSAVPKYQDATFKIHLPTAKQGTFTLWGIAGLSHIELLDSERDSSDWSFTSRGEDLIYIAGMYAGGLTHTYYFNEKLSGKLLFSASASEYKIQIDTLSASLNSFRVYTNSSYDGRYVASYVLSNKFNAHHLLKAGLYYQALGFNYNASYYSRKQVKNISQLKEKNTTGLGQAYLHWQYRITDRFTLNNGFYCQDFFLNNSQSYEPRSGLVFQVKQNHSLSLALGMHSQMLPTVYYFFKSYNDSTGESSASNRNLDVMRSRHAVFGYDVNFKKDFRFKTELYYQFLYNIPVEKNKYSSFSMINVGNDLEGIPLVDSLENGGEGKNYGIEITLEKFFSNHYYFLTTLSLYESRYSGSDGMERNSAFSGGYVCNALGGIEFILGKNKNMILAFDAKTTFAGGNRTTPVDITASQLTKQVVYVDALAFSQQLKSYKKVDLKASIKWNGKKATQTWFVNVENIFNTKNVLREFYSEDSASMVTEYQLGLFPYAGYRIEF